MDNKLISALEWIAFILNRENIPFEITGGLAAHIYGAQRPINDIDIDIPEDRFDDLLPRIKGYITFGPGRYIDEKWDCKLLTLEYEGQEIDIGGAYETKLFDDISKSWKSCPADLSKAKIFDFEGLKIPVVDPKDLIDYKRLLIHPKFPYQKKDIEVIEEYLNK